MLLREFIKATIIEYLNENFKSIPIDKEYFDFISDWKQIKIDGVTFDFMRLNGVDENKFIIEIEGVGEIGSASLNCYDKNFDGCYLDNIRIDSKYRRLGLATKMYEYIEELIGEKLKPSPIKQSQEIKGFWKKLNVFNEGFLSSQNSLYEVSKEIVSKLDLSVIIDYIMDDLENSTGIEILQDDYKIKCDAIFNKWSEKGFDDEFEEFLHITKCIVIFTNRLPSNVYGNLAYGFDSNTIKINYNHQETNSLIYTSIRKLEKKYDRELTKEEIKKIVQKYLIPIYIYNLSHELRHMFDDYRSNNKIGINYVDGHGNDYITQTSEVWASFSELLSKVKRNRIKLKDFNSSYKFLLNNFNGFELLPIKMRSKLVSYLYRYING
jgi:hypothetical protein